MTDLRDTRYARELARATVEYEGGELRIERLLLKESGQEAVRFSWWKDGKMAPRPLDLPEAELLMLFERAIGRQVFTPNFLQQLKAVLADQQI
jgi:hypothetical protein